MRLVLRWIINACALLAVAYVLPSVHVDGFATALAAALVLGLVNAVIRPIMLLLTLPVTVLTLGLFILVVNGLMFWLASSFVQGFHVNGLMGAIFGAVVYSFVSWLLSAIFIEK